MQCTKLYICMDYMCVDSQTWVTKRFQDLFTKTPKKTTKSNILSHMI